MIPHDSVQHELSEGEARLCLSDVLVGDAGNITNALAGGPAIPSSVDFELHWFDPAKRGEFRDATNHFDMDFVETSADIIWSAKENGFSFVSDAAATSTSVFGQLAQERNGKFFT